MDMIKFFITWGPTFLFLIIVLLGILVGVIRGFRKSLILFIQMLAAGVICLIVYLCIVNNPNLDSNMVKFINGILNPFGQNLQNFLSVDEECKTLHAMLMQAITNDMSKDDLKYLIIQENAAYINTLVDLAYHLIVAILCFILYFIVLLFFYLIYLIAYPVRRKIKKENKKYQNGETNHPYKRRRLLGGVVGGVRSILTAVIWFSFLGSLIYIVTGGTNLPQRDQLKEEGSVEFEDKTWNEVYDYYSYVCAMGNTGIFQVLNSLKDSENTPFYFYFADIVLQGRINDENLEVENEKFYLRDEMGEYVHFINSTFALMLKYGKSEDLEAILNSSDNNKQMEIIISTIGNDGFAEEFSNLIDQFDDKPFMTNLCLSSLTSLVNHIDKVVNDEKVVGLVNQLFKSEDSIRVTDLATEADVKNLFKGLVQVIVDVNKSQNEISLYSSNSSEEESNIVSTKQMILIAKNFIPTIQELSLFNDRADIGNKIIKGLYTYTSSSLITDENIKFDIPQNIVWIDEFNILLDACDPLLTIAYEVYDADDNVMITNLANIFENENREVMETAFDDLSLQLESSLLLDVVFKSSLVGEQIDKIVINIAQDENAKIPKNIDYVGKNGECSILLSTIKILLKNGGGSVLLTMMNNGEQEISSQQYREMIEVLTKEIEVEGKKTTLIKNILNSKLVHYVLSTFLSYVQFGDSFKLYIPNESIEVIEECKIIDHKEIEIIADLLSNCVDLIIEVIDNPTNLNYAKIFSNDYIQTTVKSSLLLQGTLANLIIGLSATQEKIVLPLTFDNPDNWIDSNGNGEICTLTDAIFNIADVTIEDGKYLINEIMNGNIDPSAFLNLEKKILNQLCASKVLRYTISDMVTDLGTTGFKIVVARASLEEVNAKTTTEKVVNVIKADELSDIFVDIQKIVIFGENDEVKINYNAIFENKEELCKSKTITATLIQVMFDKNEEGFIVIPDNYKTDFEKFKTDLDLSGNVWLGNPNSSKDDEIYLMLTAVETFIDKDADGKVPSEFDFSTLQDTLKLRESGIDEILASAILNASISKKVTQIFNVPVNLYNNEVIVRKDLNDLFNAVFKLFNRSEIIVKEVDEDLFGLSFRADATPVILNSTILRATITNKLSLVDQIYVPTSDAQTSEFVNKDSGYIVDIEELTHLFNAMYKIFETDTIMVNDVDKQLTSLEIKKSSIDDITASHILNATISSKLSENNQIVILEKDAAEEVMLNDTKVHVIGSIELAKLLNTMFIILGKDRIIVDDISNQFADLSLAKQDIDLILDSHVISSTISHKLVELDELSIPKKLISNETSIQKQEEFLIEQSELHKLLAAMFVSLDTNKLELQNLNANLGNMELSSEKVNSILDSEILQLYVSGKFIGVADLVVPNVVIKEVSTVKNEMKKQIVKDELSAFFKALFATTTGSIQTNNFALNDISLPTNKTDADKMSKSLIVSATLSTKIMTDTSTICILDELKVPYSYDSISTNEKYIKQEELSNVLLALTVGIGLNDPTNLSFTDIAVPTQVEQQEALVNSELIRATITQKILDQSGAGINSNSINIDITKHCNGDRVGVLSKNEILNVIKGIQLLNTNDNNFDNLVLDVGQILMMPNKEDVLKAISQSDVYLYIISHTLGEDKGSGIQAYQWFTTTTASTNINGVEYIYKSSALIPGRYNINYPTSTTEVYTSFHLVKNQAYVCNAMDILALQETIQYSF